jgi:hypothetical protein
MKIQNKLTINTSSPGATGVSSGRKKEEREDRGKRVLLFLSTLYNRYTKINI